ncbi:MAG: hypothetical protein ACRD1T_25685, partial [Acidimicrobiia bacterium]
PRTVGAGAWGLGRGGFAALIESNVPVIAERDMTWGTSARTGSHAGSSVPEPALTWYFAEGATHLGFDLFYLLQNPGPSPADVQIKYLLPQGPPVFKTYTVGAHSRATIWVDGEPELSSTGVAAVITSSQPIVVERSMYLSTGGQVFRGGHNSAGVTAPAVRWLFAEGATGDFFDCFIPLVNPEPIAADVAATFYLLDGQTVTKSHRIAPESRATIWVDYEDPLLANAAFSIEIVSTNGVSIVAERTMWWPGPTPATWQEGHNSPGISAPGTRWAIADAGAGFVTDTYLLIANVSTQPTTVRITLLSEFRAPVERAFNVGPERRLTLNMAIEFPGIRPGIAALVESLEP